MIGLVFEIDFRIGEGIYLSGYVRRLRSFYCSAKAVRHPNANARETFAKNINRSISRFTCVSQRRL